MRIISGKYRGKKLKEFNLSTTKPTIDRVKEAMFNLVQFDVLDAVVLDLFSGTGSLGIECISRGAKYVYMVDNNKDAINIINQNLKGVDGDYKVCLQNYKTFLETCNNKFDLIFLDPPYATDYGIDAIDYILSNDLLNIGGTIIFETSIDHPLNLEEKKLDIDKRTYGTVAVYKIQRVNND